MDTIAEFDWLSSMNLKKQNLFMCVCPTYNRGSEAEVVRMNGGMSLRGSLRSSVNSHARVRQVSKPRGANSGVFLR